MNGTVRVTFWGVAACLVSLLTGCSDVGEIIKTSSDGQGVTIDLSGLSLSGTGSSTSGTDSATSLSPTSQPEAASSLPQPETVTTPPLGLTAAPTVPANTDQQAALSELKDKYGITVAGTPTQKSILNTLLAARQLLPEDTKNLTINFSDESGGSVLGVWSSSGKIKIYATAKERLATVFHETMHQVTLFQRQGGGTSSKPPTRHGHFVANELCDALGGNDPSQYPKSVIVSSYSLKNLAEFWSTLFTNYRIRKEGLDGQKGFTGEFNPPENLRPIIEKMYSTQSQSSVSAQKIWSSESLLPTINENVFFTE